MNYLMGDIHGCANALEEALSTVGFGSTDTLWLTGDLVGKGPNSPRVLDLLYKMRGQVRLSLGNHDVRMVDVYLQRLRNKDRFKLNDIWKSDKLYFWIEWLMNSPFIQVDSDLKLIMVHAGINPVWSLEQALEKNARLMRKYWRKDSASRRLIGEREVFTETKHCLPNGKLVFHSRDGRPWYEQTIIQDYNFVFGHWTAHNTPDHVWSLDTKCYEGGPLTTLCWETKALTHTYEIR